MFKKLKRGLSLAIIMTLCLNISIYGADVVDNSVFLGENLAENSGQLTNDMGDGSEVEETVDSEDGGIMTPDISEGENGENLPIPELPNFDDPVIAIPPVDENLDEEMAVETMSLGNMISVPKEVANIVVMESSLSQNGSPINEGGNLDTSKPVHVDINLAEIPVIGDDPSADESTFVKAGDTLSLSFSDKMKFKFTSNVPVTAGDGTVIGEIVFNNTSKTAVIEFNNQVDDIGISDVSAMISIEMLFDDNNINQSDRDEPISILGKDYFYSVPERSIKVELDKKGTVNLESQSITWEVTVKASHTDDNSEASLKGYTFYDDLTNIGEYKAGSFKIGQIDITPQYDVSVLSYEFTDTDIGTTVINFDTIIKDEDFYLSAGTADKITKINTAKIFKGNSEVIKKEASVEIKKPTWIVKNYEADAITKDIKWNIEANELGFGFNEVVITDDITNPNLSFKSANLYKKVNGAWEISPYKTWNAQPQEGKYEIGDISHPIKLEIITEAKDSGVEVEYKNKASISWKDVNGIGRGYDSKEISFKFGTALIDKKATGYDYASHVITWQGNLLNIGSGYGDKQRIVELMVYGENDDFDPSTKSYTIEAMTGDSTSAAYISNEALKVIKKSEKQKYVDGSFVEDQTNHLELHKYTVKENGISVADLVVITGTNSTYINPIDTHAFTYQTVVTDPSVYAANHDKANYITNTVCLLNSDVLIGFQGASQEIRSNMIMKESINRDKKAPLLANKNDIYALNTVATGGYGGDFDYTTNSALYKIHINLNGISNLTEDITMVDKEPLGSITVTEKLPEGWEFKELPDGAKFWLYEGDANADRKKVVATSLYENDPNTKVTSIIDSSNNSLTLNFGKMNKSYILVVEAKPTAEKLKEYFAKKVSVEAINTVTMNAKSITLGENTARTKVSGEPLHKTINKNDAASQGFITWNVDYKPYGAEFENLYIEDYIPSGVELRVDSNGKLLIKDNIKVNKLSIAQNGYGNLGDAVDLENQGDLISYDSKNKILRFNIPDCSENYRLTYITDITGDEGLNVTNKVSLKGGNFTSPESEGTYTVEKNAAIASFNRNGWVEIDKKNELTLPLSGAEFTLYNHDKTSVVRKGITNDKGNLKLGAIPEGSYILMETVAPKGYILDETEYKVEVVKNGGIPTTTVEGGQGNKLEAINKLENNYGSLKISKVIEGSAVETDRDFKFALELKNGNNNASGTFSYIKTLGVDETRGKLSLDSNGRAEFVLKGGESILIKDIPKGWTYELTEEDYSNELYITSYENEKGSIIEGVTEQISVTNKRNDPDFGSLVIAKEVKGSGGEYNREFKFSIEFAKDKVIAANEKLNISKQNTQSEITLDANGKYTFYLKANESIRFDKFVKGWSYQVVEEDYSAEGYKTTITGEQKGLIETGKQTDVKFTNAKESSNETGGGNNGGNDEPPKNPNIPLIPLEPSIPNIPSIPLIPLVPENTTDIVKVDGVEPNNEKSPKDKNIVYDKDGNIISNGKTKTDAVQTGDDMPLELLFVAMLCCFGGAFGLSRLRKKLEKK